MDLAFSSMALRLLCESRTKARSAFGPEAADVLMGFVQDLEAAETIEDLPGPSPVQADNGSLSFSLDAGLVVTITCNQRRVPRTPGGTIEWASVHRVKVVEVLPL